jgi:hypothetical protein
MTEVYKALPNQCVFHRKGDGTDHLEPIGVRDFFGALRAVKARTTARHGDLGSELWNTIREEYPHLGVAAVNGDPNHPKYFDGGTVARMYKEGTLIGPDESAGISTGISN